MVQNHTCWWASCTVGLPKQCNPYQSTWAYLCFGSPTAQLAHQHVWFCTIWLESAKGLLLLSPSSQCWQSSRPWGITDFSTQGRQFCLISWVTNYSLILVRNFSVNAAMATFRAKMTLQVQRCYGCVYELLQSKQVKRSSHKWINKFILQIWFQ